MPGSLQLATVNAIASTIERPVIANAKNLNF